MSQNSSDKYVYFTVGILKDSETLDSLRQDALKHHMIDHPGQLIALRLAEYYEMMRNVTIQPAIQTPAHPTASEVEEKEKSTFSPSTHTGHLTNPMHAVHQVHLTPSPTNNSSARSFPQTSNPLYHQPSSPSSSNNSFISQSTGRMRALRQESDIIIPTSPNADQNADEAADYWNAL
jgi:hypothetical protein